MHEREGFQIALRKEGGGTNANNNFKNHLGHHNKICWSLACGLWLAVGVVIVNLELKKKMSSGPDCAAYFGVKLGKYTVVLGME